MLRSLDSWFYGSRAVRELLPDAFVFENVRGLPRPAFSRYLKYIIAQLEYPFIKPRVDETWHSHWTRIKRHAKSSRVKGRAYRVIAKGINTADYGAPQKRYRAIVLGMATSYGDEWEFPTPTHSHEALVWGKHVDCSYWRKHDMRRIAEPSSAREHYLLEELKHSKEKPKGKPWRTVRDALRRPSFDW